MRPQARSCTARALATNDGPDATAPTAMPFPVVRIAAKRSVLVIAGTRPECIKLAPLIAALRARDDLVPVVVNSGQHSTAVDATFALFGERSDRTLAPLPSLPNLRAAEEHLAIEVDAVMARERPDAVIVQGDTLTAYVGARAARRAGMLLAHVEAGLRTDHAGDPFPEEWFRRRIARLADLHFAPCESAVLHLLAEGVPRERIHRVGNTGIDSLRALLEGWQATGSYPRRMPGRVLVTLHRRENWDHRADVFCDALVALTRAEPSLSVVFPVHPNPRIAPRIRRRLGSVPRIELVPPMPYPLFVRSMAAASLVVSDSGGVQEEAPHVGAQVLVPRGNTERPEALATGFVELVDVDASALVAAAQRRLASPARTALPLDDEAPFGAGNASARIAQCIASSLALPVAA